MGNYPITRELLKKRKTTVAEFAREVGVSPTYIRMLMDGDTNYPASEKVMTKTKEWLQYCHVCGQHLKGKNE